ncbi:zinc-dependent alcohol dehydrogenase [Actinomycetospora sp. CA-084318]|uniref:zinc-dependent alcohol dehydrogenase n=1 Tax=Actinomycetospora sp. CA-084318 TaxID=3239892 RepID=UPI003D9711C3
MTRALVVPRPGDLHVARAADDGPLRHGEARVRVAHVGICGSDHELLAGTRDPAFVRYPVVPGHEWSGTVVELGPGTDPRLLHRPVVGEGFRYCGECSACRRGETNLCLAGYDETGFTRPGACADELRLPARLLHVLPDDADLRAAALIEPAACMAAAVRRAAPEPGERVAVVGGGTLGLLATQLLAAVSPAILLVVDPRPRPAAGPSGATEVATPEEAARRRGGFDLVLETAGARGTGRLAVTLARRGGRVVLAGLNGGVDDPIPPAELVAAAVSVHTVFGAPSRAWSDAVAALADGRLRPLPLISDEFVLEDAPRVLGPDAVLPVGKVLLHP